MSRLIFSFLILFLPMGASAELYKIPDLKFNGFIGAEQAISGDGKICYFAKENMLYRLDLFSGKIEIISDVFLTNLSISDDGTRIAFIRTFIGNVNPKKNFVVIDLSTLDIRDFDIGNLSYAPRAKISPNGKILYVAHRAEDGPRAEFYSVDSKTLIVSAQEYTGTVSFLEDEDKVAFVEEEYLKGLWIRTFSIGEKRETSKVFIPLKTEDEYLSNIRPCRVSRNAKTMVCEAQHYRESNEHYDIIVAKIADAKWQYANINKDGEFIGDAMNIGINEDGSKIFYQFFSERGASFVEQNVDGGEAVSLTGQNQIEDHRGILWQLSISKDGNSATFISDLGNLIPGDTGEHVSLYFWKR